MRKRLSMLNRGKGSEVDEKTEVKNLVKLSLNDNMYLDLFWHCAHETMYVCCFILLFHD
jgi:hypothetical protein